MTTEYVSLALLSLLCTYFSKKETATIPTSILHSLSTFLSRRYNLNSTPSNRDRESLARDVAYSLKHIPAATTTASQSHQQQMVDNATASIEDGNDQLETTLEELEQTLTTCELSLDEFEESDDDSESGEEGGDDVVRNKISAQQQQQEDDDDDDDSSADIARLEAEEKAAIQNGMKALSLFFDPKRKSKKKSNNDDDDDDISDESNHHDNIVISAEEDNMIGDNCYFYPAADADVFNQRPLPLIVGSREFMESCCGVEGGGSIEN